MLITIAATHGVDDHVEGEQAASGQPAIGEARSNRPLMKASNSSIAVFDHQPTRPKKTRFSGRLSSLTIGFR